MIVPESVFQAAAEGYAHASVEFDFGHETALRNAVGLALERFKAELLDHAWDGRARGAILGAIKDLEEADYQPKH